MCVCAVFTNAAGADADVSHRLAQPEFLQGGKLRLCLCTANHNTARLRERSSVDVDWFTQQDTHFSGCPSSSWGLGGWRWTLWSWKKRNTPLCVCCRQHVCSLVAFQLRPGRAGQINLLQQMVAGSSRRMTKHLSFVFQASSLGNPFLFTLFSIFEDVHRTLDFGGALGDCAMREELFCKQQHLDKKVSNDHLKFSKGQDAAFIYLKIKINLWLLLLRMFQEIVHKRFRDQKLQVSMT